MNQCCFAMNLGTRRWPGEMYSRSPVALGDGGGWYGCRPCAFGSATHCLSLMASDLARQLRLLLTDSADAPSLPDFLQSLDEFVSECSAEGDTSDAAAELDKELQDLYYDVKIDHSVFPQVRMFLAVLYHIRPILSPSTIIETWFDLVLRPALREPKLVVETVNHAKEVIVSALHPTFRVKNEVSSDPEADKRKEKVKYFRRRLMDLYLLDAHNESSGDDVLEWAELDDAQKERKACWKANLEDVLVRIGLQRPQVGPVSSVWSNLRPNAKRMFVGIGFTHGITPLLCHTFLSTAAAHPTQRVHFAAWFRSACRRSGGTSPHAEPHLLPYLRQLRHRVYRRYYSLDQAPTIPCCESERRAKTPSAVPTGGPCSYCLLGDSTILYHARPCTGSHPWPQSRYSNGTGRRG